MSDSPQIDGLAAAEVRSQLERIASSKLFHPSEQALLLLRYIVECTLDGGEAPKEYRLAVEVLGRGPEFDPRNDTIVRVQVRKLRAKLAKYYESQGAADPVIIELPVGLYSARFRRHEFGDVASPDGRAPLSRWRRWFLPGVIAAGSIAVAVGAIFYLLRPVPARVDVPRVTRMTWKRGLYLDPALASQGNHVVYTAYGDDGRLNVYRQDTRGGDPVPLYSGSMDIQEPAVSPDGRRVVFRSTQQNSGLWDLTVGSPEAPKRFSKDGRQPRFSPDGTQVVFWVPQLANSPYEPLSPLFFAPHNGMQAFRHGLIFFTDPNLLKVRLLPLKLAAAGLPAWSPDGHSVVVYGAAEITADRQEDADWWVAPAITTEVPLTPVRTGIAAHLREHGVEPLPYPACWVGDFLYLVASSGDSVDLWQARLSPRTHRLEREIRKISQGIGTALSPTASTAGTLALSMASGDVDVWTLPLQAESGKATGALERIAGGTGPAMWTAASRDGSAVAWCSRRFGSTDLFFKDMRSGTVRRLAAAAEHPRMSPDGSRIAFSRWEAGKLAVYDVPTSGGTPRRLSTDAGEVVSWFPDGQSILFDREASHIHGHRYHFFAEGKKDREFSRHAVDDSFLQTPSPDEQWVALICRSRLYLAPIYDSAAGSDDQWVQITDGSDSVNLARWSPDGNLLYFISNRDGHRCIWAQRLVPGTRHPDGRPMAVFHFHPPGPSMDHLAGEVLGFDVSASRLFVLLGEFNSTIFLLSGL